jgi:hypothetical protein
MARRICLAGQQVLPVDDDDDVKVVAPRDNRRKPNSKAREEHLLQLLRLRKRGVQLLKDMGGYVQLETEGLGDCWLISFLAGCELDLSLVPKLSEKQRTEHLMPWRERLAEFAPDVDTKGFDKNGVALGIDYLKHVAFHFGVLRTVVERCERMNDWSKTRAEISKKLKPWKKAKHFGTHQQSVHVCMGLMLQKNILEIDLAGHVSTGEGESLQLHTHHCHHMHTNRC